MSRIKVTPELATLLARDIVGIGGPPPRFPERWSPAEAAAIEKWARTSSWWGPMMHGADTSRYARLAFDVMQYFRTEHPAGPTGEPAGWPRPTFMPPEGGANPFANAPAEAARSYLAYAEVHPDYHRAMRDPKHAQHHALMAQTRELRGIAASAPDDDQGADMGRQEVRSDVPRDQMERKVAIHELQRSAPYLDKRHPAHAEAVAKMQALYAAESASDAPVAPRSAAIPPGASSPAPSLARASAAQLSRDVIDRLQNDEAYLDKHHPQHGARVAEMQRAYEASYPGPAAGGDDAAR